MNEANPFRFPTWSQINREQRRRERFKKAVLVVVAASALLLVSLLILGSKAVLAAREVQPTAGPETTHATTTTPALPGRSSMIYVVKSGDTLTSIAEAHGTTVKAIITANSLTSDRIQVGERLKIP